ncbi:tRNA epoxyqueuosine(34) reductase QueG [Prevotella dentasini]
MRNKPNKAHTLPSPYAPLLRPAEQAAPLPIQGEPVGEAAFIKASALRLGFSAVGIAKAAPVDAATAATLRHWLATGSEADMAYMANNLEKRLDPRLLVPGVRSIVSLAMNYTPAQTIPEGEYQLAAYAYGKDYHDVMKARLRELMAVIASLQPRPRPLSLREGTGWGCFVDTAPVLERYWAVQAGLGWTGRNHQLIIPRAGSMFFLGEIFLPCEVDAYDHPMPSRCGNCHRCLDACPTHAIREGEPFDAHRCLSYQLIENRRQLSPEACRVMGDTIYGCDRCQTVCPWNRFASPNTETAFQPSPDLLAMTKKDWQRLTADDYRRLFKGSAVKRAKYEGLMRNIEAAQQHRHCGDPAARISHPGGKELEEEPQKP